MRVRALGGELGRMSHHDSSSHVRRIGPFEVIREIGRGGTARVYLVRDPQGIVPERNPQGSVVGYRPAGLEYALKALPKEAEDHNRFLVRFRQEFATIERLHHTHIIRTFMEDETDDLVYYVMEHMPGGTFREQMHRGQPMPTTEVVDCAVQMALALDYAHRQDVIHRDVKPSNILIQKPDEMPRRLVLTDFGTAKVIGESGVTKSGMTIGTPEYMAPEQAEGHEDIDGRADIYALGCVLFEALAGRPPFDGSSPLSILFQQVHASVPILRGFNPAVPEELARVVERMLAKRPENRFKHADEVVDHLKPFLGDRHGADIPTQRIEPAPNARPVSRPIFVTGAPPGAASPLDAPTLPPASISPAGISAMETMPPQTISAMETMPPQTHGTPADIPARVTEIETLSPRPKGTPPTFGAIAPASGGGLPTYGPVPHGAGYPGGIPVPPPAPISGGQYAGGPSGGYPQLSPTPPGLRARPSGPGNPPPGHRARPSGPGNPQQYTTRAPYFGTGRPGQVPPRHTTRPDITGQGPTSGNTPHLTARPTSRPAIQQTRPQSPLAAAERDLWDPPAGGKPRRRSRHAPLLPVILVAALLVAIGGGVAAFALGGSPNTSGTSSTQITPARGTTTTTTKATATTKPSPTTTSTVTASTTNADAEARADFTNVTVGSRQDKGCTGTNAASTFTQGQAIYIDACASQSMPSKTAVTITLQQQGQVVWTFTTQASFSAGEWHYYFSKAQFPAGSYQIVVTAQIDGQTGVARSIPITIQ